MALAHTCKLRLPKLDLCYICRMILLEGEKMQDDGQSKQNWVIVSLTPLMTLHSGQKYKSYQKKPTYKIYVHFNSKLI